MARTIPATDELSRRIRAAAAYGGFRSVDAFADAVGIGRTTIYRIFGGERDLREMEWRQMAEVAGLPMEFFFADFGLLAASAGATQIAQAMRDADRDARGRRGESPEEPEATESPSP